VSSSEVPRSGCSRITTTGTPIITAAGQIAASVLMLRGGMWV
jgi:hypothetical protein